MGHNDTFNAYYKHCYYNVANTKIDRYVRNQ